MSASTERKNRIAAREAGTDKKTLAAQEEEKKKAREEKERLAAEKKGRLEAMMDRVNKRYGGGTLRMGMPGKKEEDKKGK